MLLAVAAPRVCCLTEPHDCTSQVIIPAPFWVSYPEMARLAGGEAVVLHSTADDGFLVSAEQLEAALTERSRLLILCTPSNPSGAVYPR